MQFILLQCLLAAKSSLFFKCLFREGNEGEDDILEVWFNQERASEEYVLIQLESQNYLYSIVYMRFSVVKYSNYVKFESVWHQRSIL